MYQIHILWQISVITEPYKIIKTKFLQLIFGKYKNLYDL